MDPEEPTAAAIRPRCYNLSFDARGRAALAEQCYPQALDLSWNRTRKFRDIARSFGVFQWFSIANGKWWKCPQVKQQWNKAQSVALESRITSDSTRQRADLDLKRRTTGYSRDVQGIPLPPVTIFTPDAQNDFCFSLFTIFYIMKWSEMSLAGS